MFIPEAGEAPVGADVDYVLSFFAALLGAVDHLAAPEFLNLAEAPIGNRLVDEAQLGVRRRRRTRVL